MKAVQKPKNSMQGKEVWVASGQKQRQAAGFCPEPRVLKLILMTTLIGLWGSCLFLCALKITYSENYYSQPFLDRLISWGKICLWLCISNAISKPGLLPTWRWRTSWGQWSGKGCLKPGWLRSHQPIAGQVGTCCTAAVGHPGSRPQQAWAMT